MKISVVQSPHSAISSVTLFIENKPEDFMVNHILNIIEDSDDYPEMVKAKLYTNLPLSVIVSDRQCAISKPIKFKKGVTNEQSRPSRSSIQRNYKRRGRALNFKK
jgi:hypothetical protein